MQKGHPIWVAFLVLFGPQILWGQSVLFKHENGLSSQAYIFGAKDTLAEQWSWGAQVSSINASRRSGYELEAQGSVLLTSYELRTGLNYLRDNSALARAEVNIGATHSFTDSLDEGPQDMSLDLYILKDSASSEDKSDLGFEGAYSHNLFPYWNLQLTLGLSQIAGSVFSERWTLIRFSQMGNTLGRSSAWGLSKYQLSNLAAITDDLDLLFAIGSIRQGSDWNHESQVGLDWSIEESTKVSPSILLYTNKSGTENKTHFLGALELSQVF